MFHLMFVAVLNHNNVSLTLTKVSKTFLLLFAFIGLIVMQFGSDFHVPLDMICNYFGHLLTETTSLPETTRLMGPDEFTVQIHNK